MLDIVGYNYQEDRYPGDHPKYPKRFIYGSENGRGWMEWLVVRDNAYVGGQFLWTGIDYLGEANAWPNRGSSAGLLDLCGFKKPSAWFRQSLWSDAPMVYLCASARGDGFGRRQRGGDFGARESWNWPTNAFVTVRCYTTCAEVDLLLNDKPLGTKRLAEAEQGVLTWQVPFEPGVLRAVGRTKGSAACDFTLRTAGAARRVALVPDRQELAADGRDVCHLEFQIVDGQGVRVPDATNEVTLIVDGPAQLLGIENGDLNSPATGKGPSRNALRGRGLAILQSRTTPGTIRLTASASGLDAGQATLNCR
jgi:hypothetical protein